MVVSIGKKYDANLDRQYLLYHPKELRRNNMELVMRKSDSMGKERRNNDEAKKKQGKEKGTQSENPNKQREKGITSRKKEEKRMEKRLDSSINRGSG